MVVKKCYQILYGPQPASLKDGSVVLRLRHLHCTAKSLIQEWEETTNPVSGCHKTVLQVMSPTLNKWEGVNLCQIKYVDLSALVTCWELREQPKAHPSKPE